MQKGVLSRLLNIALLGLTIILVFIIPFFSPSWHKILYNISFASIFIIAGFTLDKHRKFNIGFAVTAIVLDIISSAFNLTSLNLLSMFASLMFFMYIVVRFIMQISRSKEVNTKVLAESVVGYLLLSVAFAILIALLMLVDPNAITFPESSILTNPDVSKMSEYIYYSLVSLSTLGYGDVLPVSPAARSLLTFVTVTGQFYMAIIVALLIGKFAASKR